MSLPCHINHPCAKSSPIFSHNIAAQKVLLFAPSAHPTKESYHLPQPFLKYKAKKDSSPMVYKAYFPIQHSILHQEENLTPDTVLSTKTHVTRSLLLSYFLLVHTMREAQINHSPYELFQKELYNKE